MCATGIPLGPSVLSDYFPGFGGFCDSCRTEEDEGQSFCRPSLSMTKGMVFAG